MLRIYELASARQTILRRVPPDELPVPAAVLEGIQRIFGQGLSPSQAVSRILKDVRQRGDASLLEWSAKLDGFSPPRQESSSPFRVQRAELQDALVSLSEQQRTALEVMAKRISGFHRRQPLTSWLTQDMGGSLGQLVRPIRRVGLYVPGGTAPLPSSVLMSAIPAAVAGVPEIVVVAPPQRETGRIAPVILAACAAAGVEEVYTLGGAQAIAALAFGTESILAVDKIFGPGNLFVTLAKQQVFGTVGIDGLAGPTETLIIADESARPAWVAADLLAQAEHDVLASAILLTPSQALAEAVQIQVARQMEALSRADIIAASLGDRSGAVITRDLDEAVELANAYAPEHLCLAVENPWALSEKIDSAGGVFLGEHSFEVLGDYVAGPSHVMPTGGSARFASPLNVWDFVHLVSLIALDEKTAAGISPAAAAMAFAEGLDAHARAAELRFEKDDEESINGKRPKHEGNSSGNPLSAQVRPHLASLPAYNPIEPFEVLSARLGRAPEELVKLDANENPYGPSPRARQTLADLPFSHIYPDPESRLLRTTLSSFTGVPMENLMAGAGADELIDMLLRVFLEKDDRVLSCPPTFGMYAFDTRVNAGQIIEITRKADFSLDLDGIKRAVSAYQPKILFLSNPNNPDGSMLSAEILDELLDLPLLVVLDEAYIEFSGQGRLGSLATRIARVAERDNLVVLRTFSKWAGLAGLRVGYGAFPTWLMPILWKAKQPYNVNVAASTAAIASIEDADTLAEVVSRLCRERQRLSSCLEEIPTLRPYPSQANFLLCKVTGLDAAALKARLAAEHGILVRYFNTPGLKDHIRISVGRPEDTDKLVRALKDG